LSKAASSHLVATHMLRRESSLRSPFLRWVVGGFLIVVVGLLWTKQTFCAPSETAYFINLPAWLCEQTKFTDLLLLYFTYCLVIVGWFSIRSGERNTRNLERAYIFAGPSNPTQIGKGVITEIWIENHGRSPGILKEAYGEYSATEPTGATPRYQNGSARKFDSAIPPSGPQRTDSQPQTVPTRWESPLAGEQYFFGYVRYIDIFGSTHESRFCSKIFPREHKSDIAGPPAWNDWN
jgi:hypothetical protein